MKNVEFLLIAYFCCILNVCCQDSLMEEENVLVSLETNEKQPLYYEISNL